MSIEDDHDARMKGVYFLLSLFIIVMQEIYFQFVHFFLDQMHYSTDLKKRLANVEIKCKTVDEYISRHQSDTVKYREEAQEHMKEFSDLYRRLGGAADKQKEFIQHINNTRPGEKYVISQLENSFKIMQSTHHKNT